MSYLFGNIVVTIVASGRTHKIRLHGWAVEMVSSASMFRYRFSKLDKSLTKKVRTVTADPAVLLYSEDFGTIGSLIHYSTDCARDVGSYKRNPNYCYLVSAIVD